MIRRILTLPQDKRTLRSLCHDVTPLDEWEAVAQDLTDTLKANPRAVGLAAPQIGSLLRIFVMHYGGRVMAFINPVILQTSAETDTADEGCLSIPGCHARVERAVRVTVSPVNLAGKPATPFVAEGMQARIIQHECDHLDGILMTAREAGKA